MAGNTKKASSKINNKKNQTMSKKLNTMDPEIKNMMQLLKQKRINLGIETLPSLDLKFRDIMEQSKCWKMDIAQVYDSQPYNNNYLKEPLNKCIDHNMLMMYIYILIKKYMEQIAHDVEELEEHIKNNEEEITKIDVNFPDIPTEDIPKEHKISIENLKKERFRLEIRRHKILETLDNNFQGIVNMFTVGEADIFTSAASKVCEILALTTVCDDGYCKNNIEFNKDAQKCKDIITTDIDPDLRKEGEPGFRCDEFWDISRTHSPRWGCKVPDKNSKGCEDLFVKDSIPFGLKKAFKKSKKKKIEKSDKCDWGIKKCKGLSYEECQKLNSPLMPDKSKKEGIKSLFVSGDIKENPNCERYPPRPIPMCLTKKLREKYNKPGSRYELFVDERGRIGGPKGDKYLADCFEGLDNSNAKKIVKKDMENWVKERFGTISKEQKIKQAALDSTAEIRDLLDDCMEGKDDYTARKSCAKRIGMKALKASKKTIQKGVIKLATGGLL